MPTAAGWSKLNEYLLQCATIHIPQDFSLAVLEQLPKLVPFDQGRIYFLDDEGCVYDEYLHGVKRKVTKDYLEYYSETDEGRYSVEKLARDYSERVIADARSKEREGRVPTNPIISMDWSTQPHDTKFYREHLEPQGIRYSTGFCFFDIKGRVRAIYCLDRTRNSDFSHEELALLQLVAMHLGNVFTNFYVTPPMSHGDAVALMKSDLPLTGRETEIASMLLRGSSPKAVSERLGISRETVYKHISNIHSKLGVSNQSELLAKLRESIR